MDKITIGRIVHYVLPKGEHRPAIIVRVWPDEFPNNPEDHTGLNLQVFLDGMNDYPQLLLQTAPLPESEAVKATCEKGSMWVTSAEYSSESKPSTWHWPERAEG